LFLLVFHPDSSGAAGRCKLRAEHLGRGSDEIGCVFPGGNRGDGYADPSSATVRIEVAETVFANNSAGNLSDLN
jgi:hypothetical protein